MIFDRWLGARPAKLAARRLHDAAVAQARSPRLYAEFGGRDTVDGRFELLTLHVIMLLDRLKGQSGEAAAARQALFDVYLRDLDGALREMGVGDLSVGKKMRKLGEAFYGRAKAFDDAFQEDEALPRTLARTVLGDEAADASRFADYVRAEREALASLPVEDLLAGRLQWPHP